MKKKIGIITLPLNTNYGGLIQAYALQTVKERLGFSACVLDTPRYVLRLDNHMLYLKRMIKKILGCYQGAIYKEKEYYESYPIVARNTEMFIQKYIHRVKINDFSFVDIDDFYGFVVGSDQVWRPSYFQYTKDAYLNFTGNFDVKRIAYAPSLGVDYWEYSECLTAKCKSLLCKFDAVSVREDSAVDLFERYMDRTVEHVLDPTMLLSREDYVKLCMNARGLESHKDCILSYVLDPVNELDSIMEKVMKLTGKEVYSFNQQSENYKINPSRRVALPVEAWFKAFDDAKLVITDSFHACVFSIIFHKPFIVLINKRRGIARIESLLRLFKLENRIVCNVSNLVNIEDGDFEWNKIDEIMKKWQDKSISFLIKALNC